MDVTPSPASLPAGGGIRSPDDEEADVSQENLTSLEVRVGGLEESIAALEREVEGLREGLRTLGAAGRDAAGPIEP